MKVQPHLDARPQPVLQVFPSGLQSLGLAEERDSYRYVPQQYHPSRPLPLLLLLHGAGGLAHHGLPIDACSRSIVKRLRDDAYRLTYQEFDGGHLIPPAVARSGVNCLLAS